MLKRNLSLANAESRHETEKREMQLLRREEVNTQDENVKLILSRTIMAPSILLSFELIPFSLCVGNPSCQLSTFV